MAVFAVIALDADAKKLETAIEMNFGTAFFKIADGHWLISTNGTAESIGIKLGIKDGGAGRAIIYNLGGYYGFAPTNIWEWLKTNWGKTNE